MSRQDFFRLPVVYVLGALGAAVGFFMTYLYGPLEQRMTIKADKIEDRVMELEHRTNNVEKEYIELKSELKHIRGNR